MADRCQVRYCGSSYPQHHGLQCEHEAPHPAHRHIAICSNEHGEKKPLSWWTEAEKQAVRAKHAAAEAARGDK